MPDLCEMYSWKRFFSHSKGFLLTQFVVPLFVPKPFSLWGTTFQLDLVPEVFSHTYVILYGMAYVSFQQFQCFKFHTEVFDPFGINFCTG